MKEKIQNINSKNELFPVFLKLNEMAILIVGGGKVALEKLSAIISNSPLCKVTVVAKELSDEIKQFAESHPFVSLIQDVYDEKYLIDIQLVISALNDVQLSEKIKKEVNAKGLLYNAADKPELCDFYLSSTVTKGNLKIGISTNGKSPTLAKRIKETLNDTIPDETDDVILKLNEIRNSLKGDFESKVKTLNELTKEFKLPLNEKSTLKRVKSVLLYSLLVSVSMLVGHLLLSYVPFESVKELGSDLISKLDVNFGWFLLIGFIAQMIDGALGMAYGVSVTTFLMSLGLPSITPAVASASMHASEIFTTGSSSLVYMKYKNINKKMFKALVWPGVIGAVLGVLTVTFVSKEYFSVIKPLVAVYTLILGILIIRKTFIKQTVKKKITNLYPIALSGGFLDSVGGGGWGPIVTSSLLAGGRHLRYAIGSAHLSKFFVAVTSTIAFFFMIGLSHWQVIFGLVIGGMLAAPISIYFSTKIPIKKGLLLVGTLIILISLKTILTSLLK